MQTLHPRSFWALFTVVISAGVAVAIFALVAAEFSPSIVVPVLAATLILQSTPVALNEDMQASLGVVALFTAVAIGGLPLAVVVGLVIGAGSFRATTSARLTKGLFNLGMDVVMSAGAAVTFALIARTDLLTPRPTDAIELHPLLLTLALLMAGLVYSILNALLLAGVVHSANGLPYWSTARSTATSAILLQFLYVGLAAVAYVMIVKVSAISLVLLVVPLAVARQSLLSVQQQQDAFDRMVRTFVKAIELKDGYTRGHAERVSDLSVMVAESMGLSYDERQLIRYGAILHDVGKIGVSLGILCKAGPLTDDEFGQMKKHPEIGAEMLADIDFLQPALAIVHHHHERIDGRGYPAGLAGEGIPLLTRVVTAVDAFDAMTSTRSYRRALPVSVALEELQANAGTQFDTEVVDHLVAVIDEHGWEITDEPVAVTPEPQQVSS